MADSMNDDDNNNTTTANTTTALPNNNNIKVVQLDGLVLMKIIKHCKDEAPEIATGTLLGLGVNNVLEVTNCFPIPSDDDNTNAYQVEMLDHLRKAIHIDNNTVGWYQSAFLSGFLTQSIVDIQYQHQKTIPNSVVVVFDPFRTTAGHLALQAFRLSDAFMKLYAKKRVDLESLVDGGVNMDNIMEEVPIKVHNSFLTHSFLYEIREDKALSCDQDRLSLQTRPFLEKNIEDLSKLIEDYNNEQGKYQFHQRQLQRQKTQQQQYLQKRRAENDARIAAGKKPLSEDDFKKHPVFKPLPKPSRLETMLVCKQIDYHSRQINSTSNQAFHKAYVIEALHDRDDIGGDCDDSVRKYLNVEEKKQE